MFHLGLLKESSACSDLYLTATEMKREIGLAKQALGL
jgi:hypothetical protein